jgi:hypothetical protein
MGSVYGPYFAYAVPSQESIVLTYTLQVNYDYFHIAMGDPGGVLWDRLSHLVGDKMTRCV